MIDRVLESASAPYKLAIGILLFFDELSSSIRSRDIHREVGIIFKITEPDFKEKLL